MPAAFDDEFSEHAKTTPSSPAPGAARPRHAAPTGPFPLESAAKGPTPPAPPREPVTPPSYNRPLIVIIVVGVVGALATWALAPYLMVFFLIGMLAAAVTVALIQDKQKAQPAEATHSPKAAPPTACPHCGYDLRGLPLLTMKCPECGRLLTDT